LPPLEAQHDAETLPASELPFYTHMSGTSMATPHVAGILALILEANPHLTPMQVKDLLERTATNMTGRLPWEAGAGHVNAYAAIAEAAGVRAGWGGTVNALRAFNANALLAPGGASMPFSVDFAPVGTVQSVPFDVGPNVAWVTASASTTSTVAVVLIDPDGNQYGSAIGIPAPIVGNNGDITTGAPGKAGRWYVTVRGIGSVSGTDVDPANVTNGYAAPGTVSGTISFLNSGGYTGMGDVANHPARQAIEYAVSNRLVDGYSDKSFRPDALLKRSELAQYLLMGQSVRQSLPFSGTSSFTDLAAGDARYAYAESAVARGGALRDLTQSQDGVMGTVNGAFRPNDNVTPRQPGLLAGPGHGLAGAGPRVHRPADGVLRRQAHPDRRRRVGPGHPARAMCSRRWISVSSTHASRSCRGRSISPRRCMRISIPTRRSRVPASPSPPAAT
jgi:serine protease AprX